MSFLALGGWPCPDKVSFLARPEGVILVLHLLACPEVVQQLLSVSACPNVETGVGVMKVVVEERT